MADHVVLVGMMGSGKTTVGRALAQRLGWVFLDSDDEIVAETGRTVAQIFESEGEAAFRRLEAAALARALAREERSVIAAAGGVVLDPVNRARLKEDGLVVWLRAEPAVLARRVGESDHRPLLADDPEGVLHTLHQQRRPLYEEVADHIVDVDRADAANVVEQVLDLVEKSA